MRRAFADTSYFIGLLLARDQRHREAAALDRELRHTQIVTTDAVLVELLAYVAGKGPRPRAAAISFIDALRASPDVLIVRQTDDLFDLAFELYRRRPDKGYSLTDCMSMIICRQFDIDDVATSDVHFAQEGFVLLLNNNR